LGKPFTSYDFDDATQLVGRQMSVGDGTVTLPSSLTALLTLGAGSTLQGFTVRRTITALAATEFYSGNHWMDGLGFIGQLPPPSLLGAASIKADIRAGFVTENVVKEVVKTHVGGILGREPIWSFLQAEGETDRSNKSSFENVTGETLTKWWNNRMALRDLQLATTMLLCEGKAVRRIFFPRALKGVIPGQPDLASALNFIYFETVPADVAGVFTDPDTQANLGIFLFQERDNDGNVTANCAELSFLNDAKQTVCRIVRDKGAPTNLPPYDLGGQLLIYELTRDALITEQVQSNQRALNLAHTMMMRNVNLAGSRERTITNAQPPLPASAKVSVTADTTKVAGRFPGTYKTGAGAVNFVNGWPIYSEDGRSIVGYTNPNVSVYDPVSVETFKSTIDQQKQAIYSQCHQRHVLIVDKADTSGRAREVARREFERSLKETKTVLDAGGRWQLETTLRLAAQLANQTSTYATLRADFNCLIDAGDPDPEQQKTAILLRQPGGPKNQPLISDETARNMCGVEDAAAEKAKIEQEAKLPEAQLPESGVKPIVGQQVPKPTEAVN
jgi:hypothetical protein